MGGDDFRREWRVGEKSINYNINKQGKKHDEGIL